jgi:hypothetical protein
MIKDVIIRNDAAVKKLRWSRSEDPAILSEMAVDLVSRPRICGETEIESKRDLVFVLT